MKTESRSRSSGEVCFAVINDLHAQFAANPKFRGYPGANVRAEWMLAQFAPGGAHAGVDFVIGAGDLIHGEDLPSIRAELRAFARRLRRIAVPFYPCCGNHEVRQREGDAAHERPYARTFGARRFDYTIPAGPAEIVVFDNAGTFHVTAPRREARMEAFKRMLTARPRVPKIVVCHVPLVPVRERDVLRESFGFISYNHLEEEILDVLDTHGAAVRLVISGHLHLTGMARRRGVVQLVTAGTASLPHDYALVRVAPGGIDVEVRALPAELREPASNIHGPPRYARGYTDARHRTPLSYLCGHAAERRFAVPLRAAVAVKA